jgi:thiamine-monophosphate kinase
MKVSELGEFGLIDLLSKIIYENQDGQSASRRNLLLGIGDDAAAWQSDAPISLATVDCLTQDVHFSLDTATWKELGWKAMAASLSDIAAIGGIPGYALVSLGLPGDTEVDDIAELYRGMIELGNQFCVSIIGGNLSSAAIVFISTSVFGSSNSKGKLLTRRGARAGDDIAVTGYLGGAAAGLEMLKKHMSTNPESSTALRNAFFRPRPRIAEGQLLAEQGVKAAIDLSDGLVSDLCHLCRASRVGARIGIDRVPVHPVAKNVFGERSREMALSGGEDYELLFTAGAEVIARVKAVATFPVTVIGEVVSDRTAGVTLLNSEGNPYKTARAGWQHFV